MSELEEQMKQLSKQMEEYKRLKANNVVVIEDEDKQHVEVLGKSTEKVNDKSEEDKGAEQISSKDTKENNMSSDDSSNEDTDTKQTKSDDKQKATSSSSSSSSDNSSDSDDSSDDDDDDDDIAESSNTRSRGKRRRGRRDNTKPNDEDDKVQETQPSDNDITPTKPEKDKDETETTTLSKKTAKKDDKRRCIGRKPITDYSIGKTYSGTIKYIKPKLGAFIDIGSHSDAFCHISCISNEFVSSVSDVVKEDDIVENVRVIEIDREKKRITVSLRSEDMAENEKERLNSTRQYENNMKKRHTSYRGGSGERSHGGSSTTSKSPVKQFVNEESTAQSNETKSDVDLKRERKLARRAERRSAKETSDTDPNLTTDQNPSAVVNKSYQSPHSGEKSAADLKRERKIARRAERRAAAAAAAGY